MKRPLFWASVGAIAGSLCAFSRNRAVCVAVVALSLLAMGVLLALRSVPRIAVVIPLGGLIGVLACLRFLSAEAESTAVFSAMQRIPSIVVETGKSSFLVCPDNAGGDSFRILVYSEDLMPSLGDWVILTEPISPIPAASNEGEWDAHSYYRSNVCIGFVTAWEPAGSAKLSVRMRLYRLREALSKQIDALYPEDTAAFVKAILYCEKSGLDYEVTKRYRELGIAHILAVSGLHVSVFGGVLTSFFLLFLRRSHAETASAVVMFFYGALCGFPVSCTRAVFTALFEGIGRSLGKTPDRLTGITAAAAVFLIYRPVLVLQQGFWLSFGCAYILLRLSREREEAENRVLKPDSSAKEILRLKTGSAASAGIRLAFFLLPMQAGMFYTVSPLSAILNCFVLPMMGLLLPMAAVSLILSHLQFGMGQFAGGSVHYGFVLLDTASEWLRKLPFGAVVTGKPRVWNYVLYGIIFLCVKVLRRKRMKTALTISLFGFLCFLPIRSRVLTICNLSVGQGDCSVIIHGNACIVIDCGSQGKETAGERILVPFLLYHGFAEPTVIVVSHTDSDHVNGLTELMKEEWSDVPVVLPANEKGEPFSREFLGTGGESGWSENKETDRFRYLSEGDSVSVSCGRLYGGTITLSVLHPKLYTETDDKNENSLVVCLTDGKCKALFTGDCGKETLRELAEENRDALTTCNYLKVAHHGSVYSADEVFYEVVRPDISVISVGNNSYGHPSPVVMEMLETVGSQVYVTKTAGQITTEFHRNGITVIAFCDEK